MKTNRLWWILGGIGLVLVGIVIGALIGSGFQRPFAWDGAYGMPMMSGIRPHMSWGFPFPFFGFGMGLIMLIFWLGPIAGIAALIIALTRRSSPPPTGGSPEK